jgi:hypothetical protein
MGDRNECTKKGIDIIPFFISLPTPSKFKKAFETANNSREKIKNGGQKPKSQSHPATQDPRRL